MATQDDPPIDWAKLERLFPDLLELPPGRRSAFLDRNCRDEPALRAELEAMLAASERDSVLDRGPQVGAATPAEADDLQLLAPGTRIGAWEVIRPIGRGGMGEVYLAQRSGGGFSQQAAIKLLQSDAAQHAERFEDERRILAQLDHPRIARLLDGGILGQRAWMAMEFVRGQNIADYCRERRLSLDARLQLFQQVCAAVAYAHANLVIHRDLKPANILVTDEGFVKLLDFGIAKLVDPLQADARITKATPFTPEHAAPEQIEGAPATTSIDVYALGVLLYELLCGRLPWSFGDTPLSRAVDRLLREDPQPPSQAAAGEADPPVPPRELKGDLDAIVLRCLRRTPQDRYPSVQALQDDLGRHARRRPVLARQGGRQYRLRLWLRRNRLLAAAGAIAGLSVLAGLGVALWQAEQARRQAARAEQVKELVLSVFREQDPLSRDAGSGRSPAQVIEQGIRALGPGRVSDRALRSELLDDLGEIQANLGDLQGARKTLLDALAQRRAVHGSDSVEAAETERKLAFVASQAGDYDTAAEHARHTLASLQRSDKTHSPEAARAKLILATSLINRKERDQALAMAGEAVSDLTRALGPGHPETLAAGYRHGQLLVQLRRDDEAIAEFRRVVQQIEAASGKDSAQLISPLTSLAGVLRQSQQLDQADRVYARTVALARKHMAGKHILLATVLSRFGALKVQQEDYATAQALFDQAETAMPANAPSELAQLLTHRGKLHLLQDHVDAAERDYRHAFELRRKASGDDDGLTWFVASQWGRALAQQGKLAQAEQVQRDALKRLAGILGPDAYQNALLLDALAETLTKAQRPGEAAAVLKQALTITAKEYPPTHPTYRERADKLRETEKLAASDVARPDSGPR